MGPVEIKGIVYIGAFVVVLVLLAMAAWLWDKGVIEKGKLKASGHGVKIELLDFGPSVALVLGAVLIVLFAISHTMTTNKTKTTTYADPSPADPPAQIVASPPSASVPAPTMTVDQTNTSASSAPTPTHTQTPAPAPKKVVESSAVAAATSPAHPDMRHQAETTTTTIYETASPPPAEPR